MTSVDEDLPELTQVVERLGFGWAQLKALFLGGGVWAADGAELLLIGSVTRAVNEEWGLSATQRGLIVSTVFLGVLVGNLSSGTLGDVMGRRFPIIVSYLGVFIFSVLSIFAWSFYSMASVRFIVGISFGIGQPAWNAMSGEISPAERRLHMSGFSQMLFALGEMYSAALIYINDPRMKNLNWRWLIGMGAIPSALFVAFCALFLLESPSFLAIHGRKEEAKHVLEKMRRQNGHPESMPVDFREPRRMQSQRTVFGDILGPTLLFTTLVTGFSCFTLNLLFYGGLYAFPQILPEIETGLSPAATLLFGATMEIPGYLFGLFVGVNLSRKLGIEFYLVGTLLATLLFAYGAKELLADTHKSKDEAFWLDVWLQSGVVLNKVFTSVGFLIVYCYTIEIYATRVRTTGTAVCISLGRLGSISCPLIYEYVTEFTGTPLTFIYFMAACCGVNAVLILFLSIETAGKPLKDHDDEETTPLKP